MTTNGCSARTATTTPFSPNARRSLCVVQASEKTSDVTATGVVFEPFSAVESELAVVDKAPLSESYARTDFHAECEAAINEQINIEYNVSYVYHAMYSYFSRDNVGLPGIAAYFKKESAEERHHAELLMEYQSKRGGRVALKTIMPPHTEFDHGDKGDALYAFELALSLEKLNFQVRCVCMCMCIMMYLHPETVTKILHNCRNCAICMMLLRSTVMHKCVTLWRDPCWQIKWTLSEKWLKRCHSCAVWARDWECLSLTETCKNKISVSSR